MQLRQIEYFIAVAEELNFSNAAKKLHVSQQPVSSQIKKLEDALGVTLFYRTTREVTLTPAGEAFYKEAKKVFFHLNKGIEKAIMANKGKANVLKLGYESATLCTILPFYIKAIHNNFPDMGLDLLELEEHVIHNKILKKEIDMGLMFIDKDFLDFDLFEVQKLGQEKAVVSMDKNHKFSKCDTITLAELSQEKFVITKKSSKPYFYDKFLGMCEKAGFHPNIVQEVSSEQALMSLVSKGIGISIVFDCLKETFREDISYVPLTMPDLYIDYGFIWEKGTLLPRHNSISDIAHSIAENEKI